MTYALALFGDAASPVVSQDVGWGMVILTALTLAKATASEVIGYFKDRTANDKEVALLKAEHAQCKSDTESLRKEVAELKHEIGILRADLMSRRLPDTTKGKT
jgi:hypothetical protein